MQPGYLKVNHLHIIKTKGAPELKPEGLQVLFPYAKIKKKNICWFFFPLSDISFKIFQQIVSSKIDKILSMPLLPLLFHNTLTW